LDNTLNFTEAELLSTLAGFLWPLFRISAMLIAMPVFSARAVPPRGKLIISVVITMVVLPVLPKMPVIEIFSFQGFMVAVQQIAIGLCSGFILQMVFAAVVFGGQGVAFSMGLGFASMIDPQTGIQVPVVAQVYAMTSTLLFLVMDGHLLMIEMLVDSFNTLPVATEGLTSTDIWSLLSWSSMIFAGGLLLSLPLVAGLLMINVSFGVATRAAPQLNIFAVGFPVTLMCGMLLLWLTLPNVLDQFSGLLTDAYGLISQLLRL
jgi:flagellar biosynthetic protein FliR